MEAVVAYPIGCPINPLDLLLRPLLRLRRALRAMEAVVAIQ